MPTRVYDETIDQLDTAIHRARLGERDKAEALKNLSRVSQEMEQRFTPRNFFDEWLERERANSHRYGGKTVHGDAKPKPRDTQLSLWE